MVRFTQVGLRYPDPTREGPGERETLRDLSFTLPQGSFTWLTGPSGAGKTSLLRLMQLALRPTRGEVEVLGVPLSTARREDLPALRRRIGAVFQEFRLLPYLTAFDNVALPLRLAGRSEAGLRPDVAEMMRWVGLSGREEALPQQLSGGEQQRVAIARAVVTRPALLVADEPTGNLDAAQARRLLLLLAEMNRLGATVVVATHSRELIAQYPGHVMVLEAGRVVALDPWPHGPSRRGTGPASGDGKDAAGAGMEPARGVAEDEVAPAEALVAPARAVVAPPVVPAPEDAGASSSEGLESGVLGSGVPDGLAGTDELEGPVPARGAALPAPVLNPPPPLVRLRIARRLRVIWPRAQALKSGALKSGVLKTGPSEAGAVEVLMPPPAPAGSSIPDAGHG